MNQFLKKNNTRNESFQEITPKLLGARSSYFKENIRYFPTFT